MSGNCNADTCNLKAYRLSATISSLGCPQSSTEHEFNRAKTHDSYTTRRDTIRRYLQKHMPCVYIKISSYMFLM